MVKIMRMRNWDFRQEENPFDLFVKKKVEINFQLWKRGDSFI